ncbi:MAG: hypothetical protein M3R24_13955 [Chloroflexota bacterium]|nr:hypothetical protein [Chloroflexota bacterium]
MPARSWIFLICCLLLTLVAVHSPSFPAVAAEPPVDSIIRASVGNDGRQANNQSLQPALSADGRYIAFASLASNVVSAESFGWDWDLFVHDRTAGTTERAVSALDGAEPNGFVTYPALSADGRYVAFQSSATNLVDWDENGYTDVFVTDRATDRTIRVSEASDGTPGNYDSENPAISGDGRYVAFRSGADSLAPGTTGIAYFDVFVHDVVTRQTSRVSIASDGSEGRLCSQTGLCGTSTPPAISADGRYVAFESAWNDLVPNDTNAAPDIFVHDRVAHHTVRISQASDGQQPNNFSYDPAISADGRYVAFYSYATNLSPGDTNGQADVFVHDRHTQITTRVTRSTTGTPADGESFSPSLSADGRRVAFWSDASNLVATEAPRACIYAFPANGQCYDVYVHDRVTGQTARLSDATDGTQSNGYSQAPIISSDGQHVAFSSAASNLIPGDTNEYEDIFVYSQTVPPSAPPRNIYIPMLRLNR